MITAVVQRWRDHRGLYRPAGEVIQPLHYEVAAIPDDTTAHAFVEQHHYSGSYPNARFRFGLYWGGLLVGVAVFSHPVNDRVLAVFPGHPRQSVELGRLVLLDLVPAIIPNRRLCLPTVAKEPKWAWTTRDDAA